MAASAATMAAGRLILQRQLVRVSIQKELAANENYGRFLEVLELVRQNYVEEADLDALLKGATHGAVDALEDPYSFFYDVEEFEGLQISLEGAYEGIGVVIMEKDRFTTVQSVINDSPGATTPFAGAQPSDPVGLQPGDRILEVDGQDAVGLPMEQVGLLVRGPSGSKVNLVVGRDVLEEGEVVESHELTFAITRAKVDVPTVTAEMLDDGIGYLHLMQFTGKAPADVGDALAQLSEEGMRGLVLDLRDNPGGSLQSTQELAGYFVPDGPVVHIISRNGEMQTLSSTKRRQIDVPLVVLVNGHTASAAEILAGAVQDYGSGTILGETTFGKGSVQQIWSLADSTPGLPADMPGPTGLKVTTARYLTAKERSIDGEGIEPDVVVPWRLEEAQPGVQVDPQLQQALELLAGDGE